MSQGRGGGVAASFYFFWKQTQAYVWMSEGTILIDYNF